MPLYPPSPNSGSGSSGTSGGAAASTTTQVGGVNAGNLVNLAVDASGNVIVDGVAASAAPTYSAGANPLSLNLAGALRVTDAAAEASLATIATNTGAQNTDTTSTGTIAALNGTVAVYGQGNYTVTASITGTFSATLVAEGQLADLTWIQIPMYTIQTTLPYPSVFSVSTPTSVMITGGGYLQVRIRASAYTSGTVNVALDASLAQQSIFASQLGSWAVSTTSTDLTTTGTIAALNASVTLAITGSSAAYALISGTWSATIQFQGTVNGSTWVPLAVVTGGLSNAYSTAGTTTNGGYRIALPAAFTQLRATATAYTSGTATVQINASTGVANSESIQLNAANLNAQVVGNVAAGASDSGNGVKVSGVYQTTIPALTAGQRGDIQVDSRSAQFVTPLDGARATYSASITNLAAANTATDIFTITGSATKTIRVTKILMCGTQTTQAWRDVLLIKRSAANTGGTSTNPTAVPHDSNNAAATATISAYTVNPTGLGAAVGTMRSGKLWVGVAAPGGTIAFADSEASAVLFHTSRPSQAIVLRGTSQVLAINLNSVTSPGNAFDISIEWTEE